MFHSHSSKEPADFSQKRYAHTDDPSYQMPQSDDSDFGGRKKFSIFRPRLSKPNLLISICINTLRLFALVIVLGGLALAGAVMGIAKGYMETAPNLDLALLSDQDKTSFLYDTEGNVITDYKGTENRVMVSISAMPENLCNAFVAVEDARFYTHNGIDVKRIIGSFVTNFTTGSQQGGSTITQQLIKNTVLSSEQSYKRKIQEAYLAMQLESRYTKAQILECYLNTIYLGENYYGVEVAAQGYFGKSLSELTLRECAMLAGLTNNPYYYNPRRNFYVRQSETTDYRKLTNNRTDYVLRCMYENEFITQAQYQEALNTATANVLETSTTEGDGMYQYAHYVEYAVSDIIDCFLKLNNLENTNENRAKMENELRTGGYHIYTTLDTSMQETLQSTISNYSSYPRLVNSAYSVKSETLSDGTVIETKEPQAASVIMEQGTGYLRAIVGSRDEPTIKRSLNRAYQSRMAVGSSIKPIAVYGPALDKGDGLGTVVPYIPAEIDGWISSAGYPTSDSRRPYGPVTIRRGIVSSLNIVAARVLMSDVGLEDSYSYLLKLGISEKRLSKTGVGLALGSSGITVIEMSGAYAALANGGTYIEPISFTHVTDKSGNTVMSAATTQRTEQVYKPSTAYMLIDALTDAVKSGTGTNAQISGMTVAGKTGTNADNKGVFFAGVTPYYVSTVWVGHDDDKPLRSTSGGSGAAPLWRQYMSKILQGKEDKQILSGSMSDYGVVEATVCSVSGMLPTGACYADTGGHRPVKELFAAGDVPTEECTMHSYKTVCSVSGMRATSYCPGTKSGGVVDISGTEYEKLSTSQLHSCFSNLATNGSYCSIHTKSWYIDSQTPSQPEESDTSESPEPSESASPESSSGAAEAEGNANAAE